MLTTHQMITACAVIFLIYCLFSVDTAMRGFVNDLKTIRDKHTYNSLPKEEQNQGSYGGELASSSSKLKLASDVVLRLPQFPFQESSPVDQRQPCDKKEQVTNRGFATASL